MPSIFSSIAEFIIKRPNVISLIFLVMMIASLFGMTMLSMKTGDDTYLDPTTPRGILMDHYSDVFQKETVILMVECDDSTSPEILQYIDSFESPLLNLQYVSSVSTINDVIRPLGNGALPRSSGEVTAIVSKIPENILKQYVPSGMMNLITVNLQPGLSKDRKTMAMENIRKFIDSTHIPPGVSIELTGSAAFNQQMSEEMGKSMGTLIMAALVLMVIVMGLLFTYVNYRFLPVLMVSVGLLLTFGIMGLLGIQISMAVIAAFPVLIGLGIDYAIQIHSRMEEEARDNSLPDAIRNTITKTGPAVMYAMVATALGFLAMFVSPVPMIQGFGLVSIMGIVTCYLTSLIGIPLVALYTNYKAKGHGKSKQSDAIDSVLSKIAVSVAKNPIPVLLIVIIIAFVGLQLDPRIPVITNEKTFVNPLMPAKVSLDKVTRLIGSTDDLPILIHGSDALSLESITWMQEFVNFELKTKSKITRGVSIADYVRLYNNGTMPQTESELNAVLFTIPDDIKSQFVYGNNEAVISFNTIKLETEGKETLENEIYGDLKFLPPPVGLKTQVTGNFDLYTSLVRDLVEGKEVMTYLGFLLVVLFLIIVYRNVNAISPIVPIVAIVGWNGLAMYVLNIPYTPLTTCLGSMTIGVAAEYTILVMERYIEERENTSDPIEAIKNSVRKIGSAIFVSGFATLFGFSALLLATFPLISNFGITTVIALLFSLIGAIFVMPAVLAIIAQIVHKVEDVEEKVLHHPHISHE